jgi:DNA-binding MarR family transcriptional regulator
MPSRGEPDPVEWVREQWARQGLPEPDRLAAVASLMRGHQLTMRALSGALRPLELTPTGYLALVTLALSSDGTRTLGYLSRYLLVHPTTVTQLVDQLERRGVVRRRPHPDDRRTSLAALTKRGRTLMERATEAVVAHGFGLGAIDEASLRPLLSSLQGLREGLGDLPDAGPE